MLPTAAVERAQFYRARSGSKGSTHSPCSSSSAAFPLHFLLIELNHIGNLFLGQALLYPLVSLMAKQLFGHFGRQLAH